MRAIPVSPSIRRSSVVALLASMMLLASCGSATVTASSTTEKPAGTSDVTTTTVDDEADDTTTTTKAKGKDKDNDKGKNTGPGADSDFCKVALDANDAMDSAFESGEYDEDFDPDAMLEEFKDSFSSVSDYLDDMVDTAPREIKNDVKTVRDAYASFLDSIMDARSFEDMESLDDSVIDSDKVSEASDRVEEYLNDVCGLDTAN